MEYKDIEVFLNIVRTRNITKTAENMFLSQSTISTRLKKLEEKLGCQLIIRDKGQRAIQITESGKAFIPIAERWENLFQETFLLKDKNYQKIRIATNESTFHEFIRTFSIEFMRKNPNLRLSIKVCDSSDIYDLVENNLVDYGFASLESFRSKIEVKCINTQKICLIKYCENPGEIKKIHPRDLDISKEIRFTGGHFDNFDSWYNKWFDNPYDFHIDINSPYESIYYLKNFDDWELCPEHLARELSDYNNLQIYELEDAPSDRRIYMIQREDSSMKYLDLGKKFEKELDEYLNKTQQIFE